MEIDGDTCDVLELQQVVGKQGVVIKIDANDVYNYGYLVTVQFDKPIFLDSAGHRHDNWEFNLHYLKKVEEEPQGVLPFAACLVGITH